LSKDLTVVSGLLGNVFPQCFPGIGNSKNKYPKGSRSGMFQNHQIMQRDSEWDDINRFYTIERSKYSRLTHHSVNTLSFSYLTTANLTDKTPPP
jgi:hypothetical protein